RVRNARRLRLARLEAPAHDGERLGGGDGMATPATTAKTTTEPPRFIELIPPHMGIDFVRLTGPMLSTALSLILLGLLSIYLHGGLNYGIDFAGGTLVHVKFPQAVAIGDLRAALEGPAFREVVVQNVGGGSQEFQIRLLGNDPANEAGAAVDAK